MGFMIIPPDINEVLREILCVEKLQVLHYHICYFEQIQYYIIIFNTFYDVEQWIKHY